MIEIFCTIAGVIGGVAVTASLLQYRGDRQAFQSNSSASGSAEKIGGIADQLQAITHRVAADVNVHSKRVGSLSGHLTTLSGEDPEAVIASIQEMIRANQQMQGQLLDAQSKISTQSKLIEKASKQARTDALTGLANRRALNEYLGNCLESFSASQNYALLLLDIDNFKNFNDSYGHTTGDAVLSAFARTIASVSGSDSYCARFGGEEFGVVLSGDSLESVVNRAAYIRQAISDEVINFEDLQLRVTSSGGLCMLIEDDEVTAVYDRADEGLYRSKKQGKNCGHWLDKGTWQPFPEDAVHEEVVDKIKVQLEPGKLAPRALPRPGEEGGDDETLQAAASVAPPKKQAERLAPQSEATSERNNGGTSSPAQKTATRAPVSETLVPHNNSQVEEQSEGESEANATDPMQESEGEQRSSTQQDASLDDSLQAAGTQQQHGGELQEPTQTKKNGAEFLDLNSFVNRLSSYLNQLRRAELPAAAIILEVIGLPSTSKEEAAIGWAAVKEAVQDNLRGIDVVCNYRAMTLCLFLPGCSNDAAIDRATKLHRATLKLSQELPSESCPSKFAISVAGIQENEGVSDFLDRLASTLEDARETSASEIIVHDGSSSHFHEI